MNIQQLMEHELFIKSSPFHKSIMLDRYWEDEMSKMYPRSRRKIEKIQWKSDIIKNLRDENLEQQLRLKRLKDVSNQIEGIRDRIKHGELLNAVSKETNYLMDTFTEDAIEQRGGRGAAGSYDINSDGIVDFSTEVLGKTARTFREAIDRGEVNVPDFGLNYLADLTDGIGAYMFNIIPEPAVSTMLNVGIERISLLASKYMAISDTVAEHGLISREMAKVLTGEIASATLKTADDATLGISPLLKKYIFGANVTDAEVLRWINEDYANSIRTRQERFAEVMNEEKWVQDWWKFSERNTEEATEFFQSTFFPVFRVPLGAGGARVATNLADAGSRMAATLWLIKVLGKFIGAEQFMNAATKAAYKQFLTTKMPVEGAMGSIRAAQISAVGTRSFVLGGLRSRAGGVDDFNRAGLTSVMYNITPFVAGQIGKSMHELFGIAFHPLSYKAVDWGLNMAISSPVVYTALKEGMEAENLSSFWEFLATEAILNAYMSYATFGYPEVVRDQLYLREQTNRINNLIRSDNPLHKEIGQKTKQYWRSLSSQERLEFARSSYMQDNTVLGLTLGDAAADQHKSTGLLNAIFRDELKDVPDADKEKIIKLLQSADRRKLKHIYKSNPKNVVNRLEEVYRGVQEIISTWKNEADISKVHSMVLTHLSSHYKSFSAEQRELIFKSDYDKNAVYLTDGKLVFSSDGNRMDFVKSLEFVHGNISKEFSDQLYFTKGVSKESLASEGMLTSEGVNVRNMITSASEDSPHGISYYYRYQKVDDVVIGETADYWKTDKGMFIPKDTDNDKIYTSSQVADRDWQRYQEYLTNKEENKKISMKELPVSNTVVDVNRDSDVVIVRVTDTSKVNLGHKENVSKIDNAVWIAKTLGKDYYLTKGTSEYSGNKNADIFIVMRGVNNIEALQMGMISAGDYIILNNKYVGVGTDNQGQTYMPKPITTKTPVSEINQRIDVDGKWHNIAYDTTLPDRIALNDKDYNMISILNRDNISKGLSVRERKIISSFSSFEELDSKKKDFVRKISKAGRFNIIFAKFNNPRHPGKMMKDNNGHIYIMLNVERPDYFEFSIKHESVHGFEFNSPKAYGSLMSLFKDNINVLNPEHDKEMERLRNIYGNELSEKEILDEALANFIAENIDNTTFYKTFIDTNHKNDSREILGNIYRNLKSSVLTLGNKILHKEQYAEFNKAVESLKKDLRKIRIDTNKFEPNVASRDMYIYKESADKREPFKYNTQVLRMFKADYIDASYYRDMMNDPEYFRAAKNVDFRLVYMSPTQYIDRVAKMQGTTIEEQREVYTRKERVSELQGVLERGERFPMLLLDYQINSQEGRHRAALAEQLGMKTVPVFVAFPADRMPDLDIQGMQIYTSSDIPRLITNTFNEASRNYKEAIDKAEAYTNSLITKDKSIPPSTKTLMVQFSSDLLAQGTADAGSQMYNRLYGGNRYGYTRPGEQKLGVPDFWEIPTWLAEMSAALGNRGDIYIARNFEEARAFIANAGYKDVMFSVMDVSKDSVREIINSSPQSIRFGLGTYVQGLDKYLETDKHPNVSIYGSMQEYFTKNNLPLDRGVDYSLFEGTNTIPRLALSHGCKYHCAFCDVKPHGEVVALSAKDIDAQIDAFTKLDYKLMYLDDKTFGQSENYKQLPEIFSRIKEKNPSFEGFVVQTNTAELNSQKFSKDYLSRSGIRYVELGIESFNEGVLRIFNKPSNIFLINRAMDWMREHNLSLIPNIIVGGSWDKETADKVIAKYGDRLTDEEKAIILNLEESEASYRNTLEFLERNQDLISHINLYNLATYADTVLGEKLGSESKVDINENIIEKSFHKNPVAHIEAYKAFSNFAMERLTKHPIGLTKGDEFVGRIELLKRHPKLKGYSDNISWRTADEYDARGTRLFLTHDKMSGYGIEPDGELVSVFNLAGGSRTGFILEDAIKNGAKIVNTYNPYLIAINERHGFIEVLRDKNFDDGQPDIVWMALKGEQYGIGNKEFGELQERIRLKVESIHAEQGDRPGLPGQVLGGSISPGVTFRDLTRHERERIDELKLGDEAQPNIDALLSGRKLELNTHVNMGYHRLAERIKEGVYQITVTTPKGVLPPVMYDNVKDFVHGIIGVGEMKAWTLVENEPTSPAGRDLYISEAGAIKDDELRHNLLRASEAWDKLELDSLMKVYFQNPFLILPDGERYIRQAIRYIHDNFGWVKSVDGHWRMFLPHQIKLEPGSFPIKRLQYEQERTYFGRVKDLMDVEALNLPTSISKYIGNIHIRGRLRIINLGLPISGVEPYQRIGGSFHRGDRYDDDYIILSKFIYYYGDTNDLVRLNKEASEALQKNLEEFLTHELQHGVQRFLGMEAGSSPDAIIDANASERNKLMILLGTEMSVPVMDKAKQEFTRYINMLAELGEAKPGDRYEIYNTYYGEDEANRSWHKHYRIGLVNVPTLYDIIYKGHHFNLRLSDNIYSYGVRLSPNRAGDEMVTKEREQRVLDALTRNRVWEGMTLGGEELAILTRLEDHVAFGTAMYEAAQTRMASESITGINRTDIDIFRDWFDEHTLYLSPRLKNIFSDWLSDIQTSQVKKEYSTRTNGYAVFDISDSNVLKFASTFPMFMENRFHIGYKPFRTFVKLEKDMFRLGEETFVKDVMVRNGEYRLTNDDIIRIEVSSPMELKDKLYSLIRGYASTAERILGADSYKEIYDFTREMAGKYSYFLRIHERIESMGDRMAEESEILDRIKYDFFEQEQIDRIFGTDGETIGRDMKISGDKIEKKQKDAFIWKFAQKEVMDKWWERRDFWEHGVIPKMTMEFKEDYLKKLFPKKDLHNKEVQKYLQGMFVALDTGSKDILDQEMLKFGDKLNSQQREIVSEAYRILLAEGLDRKAYEYARHSIDEISKYALDHGVIRDAHENYIQRIWEGSEGDERDIVTPKFTTKTARTLQRSYSSVLEGWADGRKLRVDNYLAAMQNLGSDISMVVASRYLIRDGLASGVFSVKRKEGWELVRHPLFKGTKVLAVTDGDIEGIKTVKGSGAFVVNDALFGAAEIYAPRPVADKLNNIFADSWFQKYGILRTIMGINAVAKQIVLSTALFHNFAVGRSYLFGGHMGEMRDLNPVHAYKSGISAIKAFESDLEALVKNGLTVSTQAMEQSFVKDYDDTSVVKWAKKAGGTVPFVNTMVRLAKDLKTWTFSKYIPSLKVQAALLEMNHLKKKYANELAEGKLDINDIAKEVSILMNKDFGGLHLGRMYRNKSLQDAFRLIALAPDWTESNVAMMVDFWNKGLKGWTKTGLTTKAEFETQMKGYIHRLAWSRVFTRAILTTQIWNFLMGVISSDDEDEYLRNWERAWDAGGMFGLIRGLEMNFTPVFRALGAKPDSLAYFNFVGHFRDPFKFVLSPLPSATGKLSIFGQFTLNALTGSDWSGARYTTISELMGIDDKGYYRSTTPEHPWGTPKGGQLKFHLTTRDFFTRKMMGWSQIPSFLMNEIQQTMPIPVQSMLKYMQGHQDAIDMVIEIAGLQSRTIPLEREYKNRINTIESNMAGKLYDEGTTREYEKMLNYLYSQGEITRAQRSNRLSAFRIAQNRVRRGR